MYKGQLQEREEEADEMLDQLQAYESEIASLKQAT